MREGGDATLESEPQIYDSQLGSRRPLEECIHMDEEWLDQWSCLQTTLDALAAARQGEAEAARLRLKLIDAESYREKYLQAMESHGFRREEVLP